MLARMISNSGLTLRQIAAICKENGVRIDPSYLSKLQSGNYRPASEEVNLAIAKACNEKPGDLLYAAYIEKAPPMIKEFIQQLIDFFRNAALSLAENVPPKTAQIIEEEFINLSDQDLVQRILTQREILIFLTRLIANRNTDSKAFQEPYLDEISKNLLGITMPDASMAPVIPEGARIHLRQEPFASGNIYAVKNPDGCLLVRKCVFQNGKVILIAEHKTISPETYPVSQLQFLGQVVSVTISLE